MPYLEEDEYEGQTITTNGRGPILDNGFEEQSATRDVTPDKDLVTSDLGLDEDPESAVTTKEGYRGLSPSTMALKSSAAPKKRGRPSKLATQEAAPARQPTGGAGRPSTRGVEDASESPARPSSRKRKAAEIAPAPQTTAPKARGRGRPPTKQAKNPAAKSSAPTKNITKKRRGRPAKDAAEKVPEDEWEVEKIIESHIDPDTKEHMYCVKWKGYPVSENTWEPKANLQHCSEMLKAFEASTPARKRRGAA